MFAGVAELADAQD
ncbi:Protein of unknown function [Lactobacillus delbrueckii subsp. lactis]|nr:Putative uncharacterized protein [Lactobacillus delbrueckii subsp. lactis]CDR84054.1 Protein of unknown function [Lactobacillus delbrueckii subsp. lactis]